MHQNTASGSNHFWVLLGLVVLECIVISIHTFVLLSSIPDGGNGGIYIESLDVEITFTAAVFLLISAMTVVTPTYIWAEIDRHDLLRFGTDLFEKADRKIAVRLAIAVAFYICCVAFEIYLVFARTQLEVSSSLPIVGNAHPGWGMSLAIAIVFVFANVVVAMFVGTTLNHYRRKD